MAGESILVVEDCPINLKLTRLLLTSEGYRVFRAESGAQALEVLRAHRPDLVLVDIQMPDMDGLTLTRRIKLDENTKDIPVVALTALAMKGDKERALEHGCDGYITKPIEVQEVLQQIRCFLDRRSDRPHRAVETPAVSRKPTPAGVLQDIQERFLNEGLTDTRQWLSNLEIFAPEQIAHRVHQWIGAGALLGYTAISKLARETELTLKDPAVDEARLRTLLGSLLAELEGQTVCRAAGEAA